MVIDAAMVKDPDARERCHAHGKCMRVVAVLTDDTTFRRWCAANDVIQARGLGRVYFGGDGTRYVPVVSMHMARSVARFDDVIIAWSDNPASEPRRNARRRDDAVVIVSRWMQQRTAIEAEVAARMHPSLPALPSLTWAWA